MNAVFSSLFWIYELIKKRLSLLYLTSTRNGLRIILNGMFFNILKRLIFFWDFHLHLMWRKSIFTSRRKFQSLNFHIWKYIFDEIDKMVMDANVFTHILRTHYINIIFRNKCLVIFEKSLWTVSLLLVKLIDAFVM